MKKRVLTGSDLWLITILLLFILAIISIVLYYNFLVDKLDKENSLITLTQ